MQREWALMETSFSIPYFPHVSIGWDNNPRFEVFRPGIVRNNSPECFADALRMARSYALAHPRQPPLITINSWNEWTETSYLSRTTCMVMATSGGAQRVRHGRVKLAPGRLFV